MTSERRLERSAASRAENNLSKGRVGPGGVGASKGRSAGPDPRTARGGSGPAARGGSPSRAALGASQPEGQVAGDAQVGRERPLPGDVADLPLLGRHMPRRRLQHLTTERYLAAVRALGSGHQAEKGPLPAAGAAEQGEDGTALDLEVQ